MGYISEYITSFVALESPLVRMHLPSLHARILVALRNVRYTVLFTRFAKKRSYNRPI